MILYLHGQVVAAGVTKVRVTILKGGYWQRERGGTFQGFTKTGKVRVSGILSQGKYGWSDEVKSYGARQVSVK